MMNFFIVIIIFILFFFAHSFMDVNLTLSFFKARKLNHNIFLTCYSKKDKFALEKSITDGQENLVISIKNIKYLNILENLVDNYKRLGVILDADCSEARKLLLRCKKYKVFDTKHFWLVLFNSSNYLPLFKDVNLNVDSDIKVAYPIDNNNNGTNLYNNEFSYFIDDVYNPANGKGGELKNSNVGHYNSDLGYPLNKIGNKYFERRNLTNVQFKGLLVLSEPYKKPLQNYLQRNENIEVDTLNRFHARLLQYCQQYYNYSLKIVGVTNSWGYYQPDGTMDGVVGALARKQIDFGLSPLVIKVERTKFLSFGKGTWHLRMRFIFRNPNAKRSFEIFVKPFSTGVWICAIFLTILILLAEKFAYSIDVAVNELIRDRQNNLENSWSLTLICIMGAYCQQGVVTSPNCLNGRTTAVIALWLGFLLYEFYSASLVSFLLNVPVKIITSLQEILDQHFGLGYEKVKYAVSLLQAETHNVSREILKQLNHNAGFLTRDEGLNFVKKGHYAFHVELVTAYPFIQRYFQESMICELKQITLFPNAYMYSAYEKWSSFKDIMDVCLQRFEENGVMARELHFWHPKKPECVRNPLMININTSLEDFYPALVIFLIGLIFSLLILIIEIQIHKRKKEALNSKS